MAASQRLVEHRKPAATRLAAHDIENMRRQDIEAALGYLRDADPVLRQLDRPRGGVHAAPEYGPVRDVGPLHSLAAGFHKSRRGHPPAVGRASRAGSHLGGEPVPQNGRRVAVGGPSGQKASYLLDLSAHVLDERLKLNTIGRKTDAEVIELLTAVKGIGEWTAQMFLIFALGRLDVFPHADFGLRSALKILYDLEDLPDRTTAHRLAAPWRPYASVATWYCWRLHELPAEDRKEITQRK